MGGLPLDGAMEAVAQEIAERLRPAPFVRIVTHIDTDGITGGAIASEALDRAGNSHEVAFVKKLDQAVLTDLKRQGTPLVWFIDLGAGCCTRCTAWTRSSRTTTFRRSEKFRGRCGEISSVSP